MQNGAGERGALRIVPCQPASLTAGLLGALDVALPAARFVGAPSVTKLESGYLLPGEVLRWHWAEGRSEREAQAQAQPATATRHGGAGSSRGQGLGQQGHGGGGSAETLLGAITQHPRDGEYVQAKVATL